MAGKKKSNHRKAGSNRNKGTNRRSSSSGNMPTSLKLALVLVVVVIAAFIYFGLENGWIDLNPTDGGTVFDTADPTNVQTTPQPTSVLETDAPSDGVVAFYTLDVGQGDCLLLVSPNGRTMLVDAGERGSFDVIEPFLRDLGINRLDVVVATHPHSDHIGDMDDVINTFDIGTFYLCPAEHTTKTYENMLEALLENNVKTVEAWGGRDSFIEWDPDCTVNILSPLPDVEYDDLNNWSVVLRVQYGDTAVMLTGDAELYAEDAMLEEYPEELLRAQVLKLGHHGSNTSTGTAFLNAVDPVYAVVSVGEGNEYGHPHDEIIDMLNDAGILLYRTDKHGTIKMLLYKNGVSISN